VSRQEYEEDLHAELGYRTAGRRELSQREWFSLRGEVHEVAPNPKAFEKLIAGLRAKKWAKENPDRRAAIAKRYFTKPQVAARQLALARKRRRDRFRMSNPVTTCPECKVEFCVIAPKRGKAKRFCGVNCTARAYQRARRRVAGARATCCGVCGQLGHNSRRHG
jgi:hypothetical protein